MLPASKISAVPAARPRLSHLARVGITAALITALATPPALAWGKKEQNFLAGVATTLLITALLAPQKATPAPVVQPPAPPVNYTPAPSYTSIYQTPVAAAFNSYSTNERKRIQSTLSAYGYYHGGIDGQFGSGTYNAVTAYATNTGKTNMLTTQGGAYAIYDGLLF